MSTKTFGGLSQASLVSFAGLGALDGLVNWIHEALPTPEQHYVN